MHIAAPRSTEVASCDNEGLFKRLYDFRCLLKLSAVCPFFLWFPISSSHWRYHSKGPHYAVQVQTCTGFTRHRSTRNKARAAGLQKHFVTFQTFDMFDKVERLHCMTCGTVARVENKAPSRIYGLRISTKVCETSVSCVGPTERNISCVGKMNAEQSEQAEQAKEPWWLWTPKRPGSGT